MTTIAFDGKTMAADGRCTCGSIIERDDAVKIFRVAGKLIGIAGNPIFHGVVIDFYRGDASDWPELGADDSLEVMVWDGKELLIHLGSNATPDEYRVPFSIGSGGNAALAAMRAGADAVKAVEVAITMDVFSGGRIRHLSME